MKFLRSLYQRLDHVQRTPRFKWVAGTIVLLCCLGYFGAAIYASYDLESQRQTIFAELGKEAVAPAIANDLYTKGVAEIAGRSYGSAALQPRIRAILSAGGADAEAMRLVSLLVSEKAPAWVPGFVVERPGNTWLAALLVTAWLLLIVGLDASLPFALTLLGTAIPVTLCLLMRSPEGMIAFGGIGVLAFTFVLLIRCVVFLLQSPWQVVALANTVVKESVRLRVSVVFIIALLILLPLIPIAVSSDNALRYRIQSFISYSMAATFYLAAFMTIFLACGTVAFEIRDRQIWQLLTKPVSRVRYLAGKLLGVVSVNLVILVVAGLSIFMFVQHLRRQAPANERDANAVESEILVARVGAYPTYERIDQKVLLEEVDRQIANNFTLLNEIETGTRSETAERRKLAGELQQKHLQEQRTVGPGELREFRFEGLEPALRRGIPIKLRFRVHYGGEDTHETHPITFVIRRDGKYFGLPIQRDYVPTQSHFLTLPPEVISTEGDDAGTLTLAVINGYVDEETGETTPGQFTDRSLNFDPQDLEVLYTVGGFEANYLRAMIVMWVKLTFLAMLGIACATTLSFPVACLMTFTIFLAATIGPFLAVSLQEFYVTSAWRIDRVVIKALASTMVFLFEPFGEFNPTQRLVEGRLIEWGSVARAVGLLGVVWTGLTMGLGYLAFRDRELATYSGHG